MKTLLLFLTLTISSLSSALDLYADAYRFGEVNHTGGMGLEGKQYHIEVYVNDNKFAAGMRHYIGFTNLEMGVNSSITNHTLEGALDDRVVEIEGGLFYVAKPYVKIGDKLFTTLMLDETNTFNLRVGFELW